MEVNELSIGWPNLSGFFFTEGRIAILVCCCIIGFSMLAYGQSAQTKGGSLFANVAISGSVTSWVNSNNAVSSNDVYATPVSSMSSSGNYSDYLVVSNFNFSIPSGSIISGIVVSVEKSDGNGKSKDSKVRIVKSGLIGSTDKSQNAAWSSADAVQMYGSSSDLWGQVWSVADVNSSNFGFAFSAQRTGGGAQSTLAKVDEISITVYYSNPLPIELTEFTGECRAKSIELTWQTASEVNNDYFTIEKSVDGINYKNLMSIPGIGNSTIQQNYTFTDQEVLPGTVFYRLSQTDFDGVSEIFEPIAVRSCENTDFPKTGLITYSKVENSLSVDYFCESKSISFFQIYNINGQLIYSEHIESEAGFNKWVVNQINLNLTGTFLIKMDQGGVKTEVIKAFWSKN